MKNSVSLPDTKKKMALDDEKFESLRKTLRTSARVKAKGHFESRLFERIRETEKAAAFKTDALNSQPHIVQLSKPKKGFAEILAGLFKPSFVPALGLTFVLLIAVVVYFGYFNKMGDSDSKQTATEYGIPHELIIYVKGDAVDSFSSNYPKEYSAITENETGLGDNRTSTPPDVPSDHYGRLDPSRPETQPTLESEMKLDKLSEEQRFEMKKGFEDTDGIETKGERKTDGIMKKESKLAPKKDSKTEGKIDSEKSPFNIRDEKSNTNYDNESESDDNIKQQVTPEKKANEQTQDSSDKTKERSRISRAIKDSMETKAKNKAEDSNETIQQK